MHQASILLTAFVMIMGGVWYAMNQTSTAQAAPADEPAAIVASLDGPVAE
jgi:hypothetical protein